MTKAVRSLAGLLLTAALLFLTGTADAQDRTRRRPEQIPPAGNEDSERPTPAEDLGARTLDAITSRSTAGLTFEQRADGTIGLDLQGRFMNVLTAATGKDGRLDISCHTDGDATLPPATSAKPWNPVKGAALHRLNVTGLRAPLPVIAEQTPALEEK